ncbi:hypothetical protein LSH36_701g02026 [Paralvinella palmiformis]|uniref:Uncharacterized protein n=1 Tax=Paralvinella palmiformis TaxID=53620 RepID=A0AAD9J361_9ANNE|nr:hypothetical protein LSH36_701g02026 [Paralvinella palmiformis]
MDILSLSFESLKAGLLMATSFCIAASFFDRDLSFIVNGSITFLKFCFLFKVFLFFLLLKIFLQVIFLHSSARN